MSGQEKNTLVFFFSDNGGPIHVNASSNDPFRGGKGDVFEGGMRVPFVVKWPAKLPSGKTYDLPVSSLDVFATSLGVAGASMPTDRKYDSVNLIPFLSGQNMNAPHDYLFWRTSKKIWAARSGEDKLVRLWKGDFLYDLGKDPGEKDDLAPTKKDEVSKLAAALEAWDKELVPPAFPGLGAQKKTGAKSKPKK